MIFVIGGLTFPMIAKMIMEENQAKVVKGVSKDSATAAETATAVKERPGTLENPDTPFLMLAKLTAMCMVFGTASFMLLVLADLGQCSCYYAHERPPIDRSAQTCCRFQSSLSVSCRRQRERDGEDRW